MDKPVKLKAWEVPYEPADVYALKALAAGTAAPHQQQRALRFILNASGVREMTFDPTNERVDAFNQGRRSVGWQIARLIELAGVTVDLSVKADSTKKE